MASSSPNVQQCLSNIRLHSKHMKDNLSEGQLLPALKNCSNFLNELRTSQLSPKEYYELYIAVFDSLEFLSNYLKQSHQRKMKKKDDPPFLADLYELVQYSGNIVPRLYMMIVIGTTYMSTNSESTKEIMKDMIEMCKGVQHPIRGLFLRNYLSQRSKDLLPVEKEEDFEDTVDFLMTNFIEMNKLWVRLQHQGHSSERELRYRERKELKVLVGSNLVRLSQAIDDFPTDEKDFGENYYKDTIYPIVTEQIIQCKDHLAQSYLIDVLIQIFPDNFHFATMDDLLNNVFLKLHPALQKSELISNLVDRFVTNLKYEADLKEATDGTDGLGDDKEIEKTTHEPSVPADSIFGSFWSFYDNLDQLQPSLPPEEICSILRSLIKLALNLQPDNYENLNKIFEYAMKTLKKSRAEDGPKERSESSLWYELLVAPVNELTSIKDLLKLEYFRQLFEQIPDPFFKRQLSLEIVDKLLISPHEQTLENNDDIDDIFAYLLILIEEQDYKVDTQKDLGIKKSIKLEGGEKVVSDDFLERQEKICKCLHLISHDDPAKALSSLLFVRKKYLSRCPDNIIYTYPTLILKITNLLRVSAYKSSRSKNQSSGSLKQAEQSLTNNFKSLAVVIDELYQQHQTFYAEYILKLYLNAASIADQLKQETMAYELFQQSFVVFEENLSVSKPAKNAPTISNALANSRYFSKENYESLITKITLYGSKLLKKQDQCQSPEEENEPSLYQDGKRVLECLQKALRVADSSMDALLSLRLFVEILNRCVIFNVYGNWLIDARYINGLIDLIRNNLANLKEQDASRASEDDKDVRILRLVELYFDRTLEHIADQQQSEGRLEGVIV
ncbi:hypothetical protein CXQ85_002305 [Candidozyma haemuli]|uniref:Vacuolar protein sorting-associated protein 35 n=1 Tax=Candidozyma haemuli TaxID=45357 RepID=A0A2V1ATA3_9ASCO|nr:hypothetical protein CXQ85_002305 [[Candida] haemuloni]PVH20513.1 hypothetical protein CXQ85_002305 [[Candida] haemuloni]